MFDLRELDYIDEEQFRVEETIVEEVLKLFLKRPDSINYLDKLLNDYIKFLFEYANDIVEYASCGSTENEKKAEALHCLALATRILSQYKKYNNIN